MPDETAPPKTLMQSRVVVGVIVMVVLQVVKAIFGVEIDDALAASGWTSERIADSLVEVAIIGGELWSAWLIIRGRVKASRPVKTGPVASALFGEGR